MGWACLILINHQQKRTFGGGGVSSRDFASCFRVSYDILCSSWKRSSPCFQHVPTTVVVLKQPSQSIHTPREAWTFRRRLRIPYVFPWSSSPCWRHSRSGKTICNKYRVWCHITTYHCVQYIYTAVYSSLYLLILLFSSNFWYKFSSVCVCVFFPFILDIKFLGCTSRGHTAGRSHMISHPPSFCGACLYFSREKDSAVPFPRRP